jgi:hypothetical protein
MLEPFVGVDRWKTPGAAASAKDEIIKRDNSVNVPINMIFLIS